MTAVVETTVPRPAYVRSGAFAGALSALVFTLVHDLLISDIWAMTAPMVVAGAVTGLCLGWTYGIVAADPSVTGWLAFNGVYLLLLAGLGATSVAVFEPVTTVEAIIARGGPVDDLIGQAFPMTAAFTVVGALAVASIFGRRRSAIGPVVLTTLVLVVTLGLNVSVIGLVEISGTEWFLVGELLGLTALLAIVFAGAFMALEWRRLPRRTA